MAIALVQSNEGTSAVATTNPSLSVAPTVGNLITLSFAADDYNGTPNTGWTQSTGMEQQTFHGGYLWWRISDGSNPPGGYTIGSASPSAWVMCEWSGVDATPYDISAGQFQQTSTNSYTTPSITPTAGDRLLIASMGGSRSTANTDDTNTWLNSFARIRDAGQSGFGTNDVVGVGYRLVTANGSTSYSSGCTYGGANPQDSKSGLIIAFKASAAGSDTNISPGAAQVILSRTAPSVVQDIRRDIPQGNLALSSAAPSVVQRILRDIPPGNLVLSSAAPTVAVTNNLNISPAAAQLVLSSVAPSVVRTANSNISSAAAQLAFSSVAPQVALTAGVNISPAAAQLVLSTAAPSVVQTTSANISPAAAQLVFSTAAPGVAASAGSSISPAAAQIVISRTAPTVVQDIRRDIPQGNLTLTTTPPTVARQDNRNISPAAAQLVFSSVAPGVQAGGSVGASPAAAQLVISRTAPTVTVTANVAISPAAAQVVITRTAPAVTQDIRRDIPQGNIVLSSAAPSVNVSASQGTSPAAAQLVLTGTAPTVKIDFRISPAAAQVVISRSAPSVVQDKPRFPAAGQLTITTAAPSVSMTGHANLYPATGQIALSSQAPLVAIASTEPPRTDRSRRARQINLSTAQRPSQISTQARRNVA